MKLCWVRGREWIWEGKRGHCIDGELCKKTFGSGPEMERKSSWSTEEARSNVASGRS